MERSSESSPGWENYGGKPIGTLGFSYIGSGSYSKNPISESPTKDTYDSSTTKKVQNMSEPMIGLKLGRQKDYYSDSFPASVTKSSVPISCTASKRTRTSYQNMQNPCCQVEGCNLDLSSAKDYHRRHRICESHSKSPKVIVAGMERRFCQQCSRFHDLSEFDDKKRSCRRRLSDHNARRRRLQPEALQQSPAGLASALYDRRQQSILLNGLPISVSNSTWENTSSPMLRQDSLTGASNVGVLERPLCFSSTEISTSVSCLNVDSGRLASIQSSSPRVFDQCLRMPTTSSPVAPDIPIAHSLLSSNSWSLNEAESTSTECLMNGNLNSVWTRFQPSNMAGEEETPVSPMHSINVHNAGPSSQLQEFQLFRASYESDCFY